MLAEQQELLRRHLDATARDARAIGVTDQEMAEWWLRLGARWLVAHGVSTHNVLQWVSLAVHSPGPAPLVATARSRNDFGGRR